MEAPTIALALAIYITVKRQGWEACSIRARTLGICLGRTGRHTQATLSLPTPPRSGWGYILTNPVTVAISNVANFLHARISKTSSIQVMISEFVCTQCEGNCNGNTLLRSGITTAGCVCLSLRQGR